MANVVYRGKSITFPDGMSEAEISQAMPSIADQIDADFSSQEAAKVTPEKSTSFSDKVINTAKDAAGYIKENALKIPVAIANELRNKSVVDGMDGVGVKANQESENTLRKVLDKNKKPNNLQEGSEVVDGISGIAKVGLNRGYAGLGKIEAGLLKSVADLTNSETIAKLAEGQNRYADKVENRAVLRGKPVEGFAKESIVQDLPEAGANAISSVIQTAPALGVGAASGGSALPALFGGVALQEYNEGREKDLSPLQSATRAIPMAGAEVIGEKLGGFEKIAKGLRKATQGNGVADLGAAMLESSLKELPAEELTTTLQFLVDKTPEIGLNQDATFDDYKKAVKDTALATILQSGGMGAGGAVLTNIAKKLDAPTGTQEAAEIDQQLLNAFNASQQVKQDQLQQAEADTALANITNPDASIDDAIALAEKAIDIPVTKPNGLLNTISAQEAIPASDILGDENVSTDLSGTTGTVDSVNTPMERVDETQKSVQVPVAGQKIDKEWTAFSPESGTLNIPRSEMPQVKAEHRGAMVNFLNARGVDHTQETVPASSLKPTQQEFSEAKVKKASKYAGGDRSILVSADNHVLDGHHQWLSKLNKGDNVDVIRLNAPIAQLLDDVKEFPSSTVESGATTPKNTSPAETPVIDIQAYKKAREEKVYKEKIGTLELIAADYKEEAKKLVAELMPASLADKFIKLNEESIVNGKTPNQLWFDLTSDPEFLNNSVKVFLNGQADSEGKPYESAVTEQERELAKSILSGKGLKTVAKQSKPKSTKPTKPKTLLATLSDLGGVKLSDKQDVTGETTKFAPGGYNKVFKQASNRSLKGLIESGDLDDYLPYNMRLESNGANDDAFDSTEAYDYLADKIRNGESVLPYAVVEELQALAYQGDAVNDVADVLTEDEINEQLRQATNEERESDTDARIFNTDSENSSAGSGERSAATTQTNASQQAEVDNKDSNKTASAKDAEQDQPLLSDRKDNKSDLLGENTTAKQAIADAERAKDAKRNSGNDNQDAFTLTGSNSEADIAAAAGAQDLFLDDGKMVDTKPKPQDEVAKAAEALTAAGVKGKEKLDTIKDVREGKVTAEEVADAYGAPNQATEEDGADQAPVGRIDDFGEKLEGAKKDLWKNYQKAMGDELPADAKDITLSKHFPEPDYDNLIASGMDIKAIAAIKAMRDEIPSKPKMPSKVRRWVSELTALREFSNRLINGSKSIDDVLGILSASNVNNKFADRINLYGEIGYPAFKSAKGYKITGGWTSFDKGVAEAGKKTALELPNGKREYFNDRQSAVDALRIKLEVAPEGTERKTKLDVYRVTATGDLVIGKKVASNKYIDLKGGFKSPKEAFQYYADNEAELLQLLEQRKNVRPERRSTNNPRVGIDYRLGQDVTPEKFAAEFGFRGVQFGNYVEQSRRPRDLNNAYDALLDLANIIGVPPRAISLNGTLGLAFGARGKGGKNPAAAHFERGEVVINLTKVNGFGSLGHEWFHAMDNYFSKARGDNEYLTQKPQQKRTYKAGQGFELDESIRPEMLSAFKNLMDAIRKSDYYTRSSKIDNTRTNDYWSTAEELAARAFEAYLIAKSKDAGRSNDYLANIEDEDVYEIANQAAKDFGAFEDPYPYPTRAEQAEINPLFDSLFGELKTKQTDSGNVVMFSRANQPTFYSSLTRAIEEIKTNKADPKLWKGMIKNLAQKGVKPDEVEWTGVNEWLDLQASAVTKEQLLDYLNANGVQVEETINGEALFNAETYSPQDFDSMPTDLQDLVMQVDDGEMDEDGFVEEAEKLGYKVNMDMGGSVTSITKGDAPYAPTKFKGYVVDGGKNYKELLLTLPVKNEFEAHNEAMRQKYGTYAWQGMATKEEKEKGTKLMGGAERTSYKSSHFDQANILAHIRFDERTDADGNKVLFINEVQSDWGQDGKKRGFKLTDEEISSMKGYSLAVKIEELNRDWRGDRTSKAEQDNGWAEVEAEKQSKGITDADIKAAKEAIDRNVVALPRAPFVTKTDAWVSLAMKRMVRYAAENGFDKVAFISGEQAADLYDLSKNISRVNAVKDFDGKTYTIGAFDNNGREVLQRQEVEEDKLSDYVGKDLAEKIIAMKNGESKQFKGLDLKVGGEGMRTFYNSIVPKVAKELLKKVGGQVESINMQTVSDEEFETALDKAADNGEMIAVGSDAYNALRYKQQVGFTITPEMREKVMGGLPLFNREAAVAKGLPKEAIQRAVNLLRRNWKNAPEIIVVQDMNDPAIRKAVREENERQLSQGAEGQPEGFFDDGKVYILSSEMNSADDVVRVVFHEALGHYGLRGLYGKELGAILDRIAMLRKNDMAKKAKQYGLDLNKESDKRIIAEEVLAEMAQTAPKLGFVKSAIAAIRKFLRDIGIKLELTDSDIIDNYIIPARSFVVNGINEDKSVMGLVSAFIRNNRDPSKAEGDTFLTAALEFTARNEDFFENAPSDAKDIADIASDMNTQFRVEPFGKSQTKLDGADTAWEVFLPNAKYRSAVIYEKGNEVWINVSRLRSGADIGSRIYSLAAAYAYNNDKVFIGDPLGLTAKAFYRRAENMLSSALKYGTTKHIAPHVAQTDPDLYYSFDEKTKEFGESVRKINWKTGDDAHNIKELIYTVYHGAITNLPELKNVIFDPTTQDFTTINGEQFTNDDFERVLSDYYARTDGDSGSRIVDGSSQDATVNATETSNPYRAGIRTAKRAAFYNTFLREKSRERRSEILGTYVRELQNRGLADSLKGTFYSRSTQSPQASLTPQWQVDESSKMDNVIRALQDKYIDLKRVTQEIKKAGTDIADRWNAYLQEELYHGRSAKRVQDFIKQDLTPLIEDMRMRGVGMADFEEYLWMRHAPERNKQIATINPDMQDGGAGVTTAEANSYMAALDPADKRKYEALAKRIDAITAKSRQVLVDYGLESQSTVNAWQSAYQFYVPLMREDMERGTGNGTGSGFKVKGNSSKRAMGSNRAVVDVIANIAQQYEKNVVRGEKNRVATAMIGLAKLNPNEEFWNVETPPTIRHVSKATGLVETRTDPSYKNRNNVIVARIVNKRGEIEERSVTFNEFNDRAMKMALSLNNLDVDQVSAVSNFMGNITRYFSSINTQYNPIFGIVNITRDTQGAMLNLSTTELAGKQKEVLANIMPALRGIYAETRTDNGIKSPMQFGSFTAAQKSKAQAMRALWEEYQREGGTTGFRDMYANAEERTKAVSKALNPNWWTKTLAGKVVTVGGVLTVPETALNDKLIKPIFHWLSDYNQTLENAVRLAAYKVAIDSGISKQQAASIGKNLTVNFNRKGTYTRMMGSWYAFFNAAIQGTARIGETLTGPKGKQIIAGGISIGVAQAVMLAAMGFDEDEPQEFLRSTNFIIPAPGTDKGYVTIPMPLGFNVLPNFGRITTEWLLSGAENTTERVFDIFGAVMESFNPLGGNGRIDSIIMPTVADPFNDLSKNEDWTGRDIAVEDRSGLDVTPGYTRSRDKVWSGFSEISRWINNLSGGDDYEKGQLSPTGDQVDYLVGQVTGGVGREIVKTFTTIESILTGEDLPMYKIPLAGRFVGSSSGQAPQAGKFYNNLAKLNNINRGIEGRVKDELDVDAYLEKNPEYQFIDYGKRADRAITKLKKYKRELVKEGASRDEVKLIDEQMTSIMTEFNNTVKEANESRP